MPKQRSLSIDNRRLPIDDATVLRALESVFDPEIPILSVLDMGIIAKVQVEGDFVRVDLTPTFSGCPAIDMIRDNIRREVVSAGAKHVEVRVVYDPPWTSDRITAEGRRKLKAFGLAPPAARCGFGPEMERVPCPYCESTKTEMESLFGPTLCRSIHYCHACRQSFEHFKPV